MKKLIALFSVSVLLLSCKRNEVLKEYQKLNQAWSVELIKVNGIEVSLELPLNTLNLSTCKMSKKLAKVMGSGCLGWVNSLEKGGLGVDYTLMTGNILYIKNIQDWTEILQIQDDKLTEIFKSEDAIDYEEILKGPWDYTFEENRMIWRSGDKEIQFTEMN
jgi:hypothetical protein